MSVRSRRQKTFGLFILALVVALIAGAVGFATGYGTDASKRMALAEENRFLRAENQELSGIKADNDAREALVAENEELKTKLETLTEENESLKKQLEDTKGDLDKTKEALEETETALSKAENVPSDTIENNDNKSSGNMVDKLTKWLIVGIIGVLVIIGILLIFLPKKHYDEEEEEYEDKVESNEEKETYVSFEEESTVEEPEEIVGVQTEIAFEEVPEDKKTSGDETGANVPDSLEELMLESIKRNEQ